MILTGCSTIRVLIVDDSAVVRQILTRQLSQDKSIEVVGTAVDGNFCLKKIEELQPNVVTLDLQMPRMNGLETPWHSPFSTSRTRRRPR